MKKYLFFIFLISFLKLPAQTPTQQFREDFEFFWTTIRDNYSYFDQKQTDWNRVKTIYDPVADTISSRESFVLFLEKVFYEIYDHHASLNTNTMASQRLVPTGADIWAEFVNGKPVIKEVRKDFGADNVGLRAGMEVIAFNDVPVSEAIKPFVAKSLAKADVEAENYALRVLLAGNHARERKITVMDKGVKMDFYPDQPRNLLETHHDSTDVESKIFEGNIGYLRVNNELGNNDLIKEFDAAVAHLQNTKGLILDLRNTPSGGNTSVARAIMGKFINAEGFYQKHEWPAEEKETGVKRSWVEIVSPRKPVYQKPLVILVNHWTGSVGEGIVIGFDALKRGTIIGTEMARLRGAVYSFTLPKTGIGFSFPAEILFQVKGAPRENFKPAVLVDVTKQKAGEDLVLQEGLKFLRNKLH